MYLEKTLVQEHQTGIIFLQLQAYPYLHGHMFPAPSPSLAASHVCNHFCHGEIYNCLKIVKIHVTLFLLFI